MRIALTHAYSWPEVRRGAERITQELSRSLAKLGHDVTVLTAGSTPGRSTADGVTTVKMLRRRHFASARRHEKLFSLWLVPRLVAGGFDCIHSFGPYDALAAVRASRIRKTRTVYTNLGLPIREYWEGHWAAPAHTRVAADIDVYGCMSQFALEIFERDYGRKGTLNPGGVNMGEFSPATERVADPTILFSAALGEPRKGGTVLVEAFVRLLGDVPAARLWLSGPGDPKDFIEALPRNVRDHIDVLALGEPKDQAERYGRSWVSALPSKNDSFGLVVIESLACGTPFAASNNAALPELITDGVTGRLCDPDDPHSVADALRGCFDLAQRPETVEKCRSFAARYDWDTQVAPAYARIYAGSDTWITQ